ncbi:MAG TPA: hypothetical protein VHE09_11830 [Rhizomicrobium sp.]|jgi:hypothetical protein|nr:hypothetical protein [Rhizomicrobium sp.]
MKKAILLSAMLAGTALVSSASAAPINHPRAHFHHVIAHRPWAHPRARFVLRHDFRHFSPVEHRWWAGGRWRHTWWHGRYGWWWNVGGYWYFYDAPVYPYPGYVSGTYYEDPDYYDDDDSGYDDQGGDNDQGGYDDQGPDQQDMGPGYGGGGPGTWYHCRQPEGYYPYIKNCRSGWEQVPAQPGDMGPGPGGGPNDAPPDYNDGDQGPPPGH